MVISDLRDESPSDLDRMTSMFLSLGLKNLGEFNFSKLLYNGRGFFVDKTTIILTGGAGYSIYNILFMFDDAGNFVDWGIYD